MSGKLLSREEVKTWHMSFRPRARHAFPSPLPHATIGRYWGWGGRTDVIYLIYKDGEILVETDNMEFVKTYMTQNQECSVRDARTGKKIPLE